MLQIATAFIHLLSPGFEALGSPCLSGEWTVYVIFILSIFWTSAYTVTFTALAIGHLDGRRLLPFLCRAHCLPMGYRKAR
jgi:zinc transporter 1/2/3